MFAIIALTIALFVFCMLTLWSIKRLRRGQTLRMIAAFMKRQMPVESILAQIASSQGETREEVLMARISRELSRGAELPFALKRAKVLTAQQFVVLQNAQSYGVEKLLTEFAEQALKFERGLTMILARILYPLVVAGMLAFMAGFLQRYVLPKFEQILRESELITDMSSLESALALATTLIAAAFVWSVIGALLQAGRLGAFFWWRVPFLGSHFRMQEQANLARSLGTMLYSGVTLECALKELIAGKGCGRLETNLRRVLAGLSRGEQPIAAFGLGGKWRAEFMWAIESVSNGAPARTSFVQVAEVLEDRVRERLQLFERVWFAVSIFVCGTGVGLMAWAVFSSCMRLAETLL